MPSWDNLVHLFNTTTWQEVQTIRGTLISYEWAGFSADGARLITGCISQDAVKLWNTSDGHNLLTLPAPGGWYRDIQFSPDGNTLGAVVDRLHLWQAPSMGEIEAVEKARLNSL